MRKPCRCFNFSLLASTANRSWSSRGQLLPWQLVTFHVKHRISQINTCETQTAGSNCFNCFYLFIADKCHNLRLLSMLMQTMSTSVGFNSKSGRCGISWVQLNRKSEEIQKTPQATSAHPTISAKNPQSLQPPGGPLFWQASNSPLHVFVYERMCACMVLCMKQRETDRQECI